MDKYKKETDDITEEIENKPLEVKVINQEVKKIYEEFPTEEFEIEPYITEEEIKEFEKENA